MKYLVTNTHRSPRGVYDATGVVRIIQPGKSIDVELSEDAAAELISGRGKLKASRQRVAIRESVSPDPSSNDVAAAESDAAGEDAPVEVHEVEPAEAGDSGVVVPKGNKPGKANKVVDVPKGKGGGKKKGPASGR